MEEPAEQSGGVCQDSSSDWPVTREPVYIHGVRKWYKVRAVLCKRTVTGRGDFFFICGE